MTSETIRLEPLREVFARTCEIMLAGQEESVGVEVWEENGDLEEVLLSAERKVIPLLFDLIEGDRLRLVHVVNQSGDFFQVKYHQFSQIRGILRQESDRPLGSLRFQARYCSEESDWMRLPPSVCSVTEYWDTSPRHGRYKGLRARYAGSFPDWCVTRHEL